MFDKGIFSFMSAKHFQYTCFLNYDIFRVDNLPMKKVSSEHDGIFRRVDGVNPSGGDEEGVASLQLDSCAVLDHVAKKYLALLG